MQAKEKIFILLGFLFGAMPPLVADSSLLLLKSDSIISAKNTQATLLYEDGFFYEAERMLKEVLELKKTYQPDNLQSIANTYTNLGILNKRTFRADLALDYYERAEMIFQKDKESLGRLAAVYYNISSLYYIKQNFYKAGRYIYEAKSILDTIEVPSYLNMALLYSLSSSIELKNNNEEKALQYFKIAEKEYSDNLESKLFIYDMIVHTYLFSERFKQHQEYVVEYLSLYKEYIDKTNSRNRLIYYYLYRGLYEYKIDPKNDQTLSDYLKALEILRGSYGNRHPLYNTVYTYIIKYFFNEGNYLLTLDYVQKAFMNLSNEFIIDDKYDNPDPDSFNDYDPVFFHLRYKILSLLYLHKEEGNINFLLEAKKNADYTLSLIEKLKWKYDHENHKYYISEAETEIFKIAEKINYDLFVLTGEEEYRNHAFELSERSKAFSLLINLRAEQAMEFGGIPPGLIRQESEVLQKISAFTEFVLEERNLEKPDNKKIRNWESSLFDLNKEHDQLIEFFEENYPEYYRLKYDTRVISSQLVQKELGKNEVILEYSLTDSLLFTYVLSNKETNIYQQRIDTSFRSLCLDFYKVITEQSFSYGVRETFRDYSRMGHQLYKLLIEPIKENIEGKNVILVPDGEISYVSFEALLTKPVDGDNFSYYNLPYLVLDHGFSNSFSATVYFMEPGARSKTTRQILAFAPSYINVNAQNTGFELLRQSDRERLIRIPGVKEEVEKISGFMDTDVYQDLAATESNFKRSAPYYKVLHLAMHTILDDVNPLYSKLAFTQMVDSIDDGFLHTYEIYNMQINADLAVLSSCNSGFGELQEGEGIQSLAQAFAYAGCPSILMTLWEVADKSTVELMERFYFYLDQGVSKSDALRLSKIDFLRNADQLKSNPFFWSSFVLVGDTDPIYTNKDLVHLMNLGILMLPLPLLWFFYRKSKKEGKNSRKLR